MRSGAAAPAFPGAVRSALDRVGRAAVLAWEICKVLPRPRSYLDATLQQAYLMGIRSLPLVLIMAVLGGAVTSQQAGTQFIGSVPLWVVGSVLAAGVLTELGPVLTGMVLVGRIGASIAAELAAMRITEQIDALYAMGRDPITFLVVPRVLAGVLVLPPLVILADAVGILSGWGIGLLAVDGLTTADVVYGMRFYFRPIVLIYSVLKAAVFGFAITFLSCFIGLEAGGGSEGVGRTTTAAVVATTLAIMVLDFVLIPVLKAF